MSIEVLQKRIKIVLGIFFIALVLSGLTAIPLQWEMALLNHWFGNGTFMEQLFPSLSHWITYIHKCLTETYKNYPFIPYGTDWLAFGHIIIAISLIGPWRDPIKNIWVIEYCMIACLLIIPTALIFGSIRGIPFFWRLIDCSFGILGIIPLWICRHYIKILQRRI